MSPLPWEKPSPKKEPNLVKDPVETKEEAPVETVPEETLKVDRTVVMSELNANILEQMLTQPKTIAEIDSMTTVTETQGMHRMSLSDHFEKLSHDCTRGDSCRLHKKDNKGNVLNPGKYTFRWIFKHKQAIDFAYNVRNWRFVNRVLFPETPKTEFTAHGGVERGDAILMFMTFEQAKRIREAPSKRSRESIRARMTPSKDDARKVLMSGNPDDPGVYMPDLSRESSEAEVSAQPGSVEVE